MSDNLNTNSANNGNGAFWAHYVKCLFSQGMLKGIKNMNYPKDKILKKKIDTEKSKDFSYESIILIWFMKERYSIIKKLYKDYIILINNKNNNYISFEEDLKIVNYFGIKEVNTIYLNNLEIEEINCYKNNKYNELYLKVKLIELLEDLCKRVLE